MARTIEKDGRVLTVQEFSQKWKVSTDKGGLQVSYDISKADYPTFDDLKAYVLSEPMF